MTTTTSQPHLLLHTYFRSSCSARVRIAFHLKSLPFEPSYIHLLSSEQTSPTYTLLNPSATVPTLTIIPSPTSSPEEKIVIRQSIAILEFLDEYFPDTYQLLPKDPVQRAKVRELVNIIACDIQPPTNLRILKRLKSLLPPESQEDEAKAWAKGIMEEGLKAFDILAEKYSEGEKYCVGNEVSMADVVLAPAVEGALRFGVDVRNLGSGTVWRVWENAEKLEAFRRGHWRGQGDTPEELREA